jgi:hypothetical protein
MTTERRVDAQGAKVINAAIEVDGLWGCVRAWHYLRVREMSSTVALRVLSSGGPRRSTDAVHPAVRDALARRPEQGMLQRSHGSGAGPQTEIRRSNVGTAFAVEHAISLSATCGRHYAESLLRIYGLDTATVMRVLFQPQRRRRV